MSITRDSGAIDYISHLGRICAKEDSDIKILINELAANTSNAWFCCFICENDENDYERTTVFDGILKEVRKKDEITAFKEKRLEENDIHVKRRSEERRDAPKWRTVDLWVEISLWIGNCHCSVHACGSF